VLGLTLVLVRPVRLQRGHWLLLGLAGIVVAAYAVVIHEQLVEHPWFRISSPHPLWQESSKLLGTTLPRAVTVAHGQPWLALGPSISMLLALACSFLVSLERDRARQLVKVVAWSGAAYAAFGIASYIADPTKIFWRDKQAYTTVLTATFINRNTAAVYFGACALIWQLILFERIEKLLPPANESASGLWRLILFVRPRKMLVAVSMFLLCLAAMLLTGSRAGVIVSLGAMIASPALFFRRRWSRKGGAMIVVAAGIGFALVLLETIGSGVNSRFNLDRLADGGRLEAYRSTLRIIADYPWLGTGLGTFPWVFPSYRTASISMWGIWDRGHSTPLELASEMGVPIASLVAAGWIVMLAVLLQGIRNRRRDLILPLAGCLVALLALLHSSIDFSLQIPGFSIMVAAIVGCGLAQSFRSVKLHSGKPTTDHERPAQR
jgi:O-antigen ligase